MVISHSLKVRRWPLWLTKGPNPNTEVKSFKVYMSLADQQKQPTSCPKACTRGCQHKLQLSPSSQEAPIGLQSERKPNTKSQNAHLAPQNLLQLYPPLCIHQFLAPTPLHLLAPDKRWRAHALILFPPQGPHAISPGITRLIPKWVLKQRSHLESCANPYP